MPCRILVADDSTPIQKVIRIAFSKYHVDIVTAGSLNEAIKEAEKISPELVIIDASLPGITTATDFTKLMVKIPNASVVVLMGTYDSVRESDVRGVGLSTILKKPFDAMELLDTSEKLLPGRLKAIGGSGFTKENMVAAPSVLPSASRSQASMPGIPSFLLEDEPLSPQAASVESKLDLAKKGLPAFEAPKAPPLPPTPSGISPFKQPVSPEPVFALSADPVPRVPSLPKQNVPASGAVKAMSGTDGSSGVMTIAGISAAVEEFVRKELPALVDRAVERYCNENFKGAAREVLTAELRRLAEEKARYLVDQ